MAIRVAILTISDRSSRGVRPDTSGPALKKVIFEHDWNLVEMDVVPDEIDAIQQALITWSDSHQIDIILTTGGTGVAPRDVTPEATLAVIERQTPGLCEAMRSESLKVTPHAMLSRAAAGIRKTTLIINLPGSPKAAVENLLVVLPVLPHAVELLQNAPTSETGHSIPKP